MLADLWCYNLGGVNPTPVVCEGGTEGAEGDTGGNLAWDPSLHVAQNPRSGAYEIDATFMADLKFEGFASLTLDQARAVTTLSGYSQLVNVASTDLVALLGLESGDILVNVNGHELNNTDAMVDAYAALSQSTSFVLTINRSGTTKRLSYELVD